MVPTMPFKPRACSLVDAQKEVLQISRLRSHQSWMHASQPYFMLSETAHRLSASKIQV